MIFSDLACSVKRYRVLVLVLLSLATLALLSFFACCEPFWTLGVLGVVVVLAFLVRFPTLFFYLCILSSMIMTVNFVYDSPVTIVNNLYSAALVPVALFVFVLATRAILVRKKELNIDFSIYVIPSIILALQWVSLSWSLEHYNGLCLSVNLTTSIVFFWVFTSMVRDKVSFRRVLWVLLVVSAPLFVLCMLSRYKDFSYVYNFTNRIRFSAQLYSVYETVGKLPRPGGFGTPQAAANVLSFCIFCITALMYGVKSWWKRILLIIWCCVLFMGILITATKAAILGCLIGLWVMFYLSRRISRCPFSLSVFVLFLFVSLLAFQLVFLGVTRLVGGGGSTDVAAASISSRMEFWSWGFDILGNRWIGAGAGGYLSVADPVPYAHSLYYCMLFDLGVVGFLLLMGLFAEAFMRVRKALWVCVDNEAKWWTCCICGAFVCLLVHSLVDLDYTMSYFWLVMGVVYSVSGLVKKRYRAQWDSFPVGAYRENAEGVE